ncbi:hypothetical protein ACFRPV_33110 [Kitasatospora sp. NPDC056808]|uniref:hypothetical protein n=1 Tax=Kitasatospora sp. NPDC056789 TaxID=3345945 RepID=UPI00369195C1
MSDADFPDDLLDLQRRWYEAEAAWAADPSMERRAGFAGIGGELYNHPYWAGVENRHKAAMALKAAVRPGTAREPAA